MRERKHPVLSAFLFIAVAALFLGGWFAYWEARNHGFDSVGSVISGLPIEKDLQNRTRALGMLADLALSKDGKERTYLVLFQNNFELRPGGGFIGSFGILKVKDGHMTEFTVHDTGNFDVRIPDTVEPPYPMRETLHIRSWKMRDSNWSPDFPTDATQAVTFYGMGGGMETFDGVVGITADVLSSFLSVTGPVRLPGFPGTYGADNAIFDLEYQVEQGYRDQNIDFGERKSVLGMLGSEIMAKVRALPPRDMFRLSRVVLRDLDRKDIQLYFFDANLERRVADAGWGGSFDSSWSNDFLMVVDANLDSWKTDSVMKRSLRYEIDRTGDTPKARLTVGYKHTGLERNFMVKDYRTYLRVYVPEGSFIRTVAGGEGEPVYGTYSGKKFVGTLVSVSLGTFKDVVFEYDLPSSFVHIPYDLKIERQAGTGDVPVAISITGKDGSRTERELVLDRDFILGNGDDN
ncbi:MAG: DUF4012 domain-containing protein [Candidatus Moranbacteria bacterium]|nr:DUF4012 domain-containing protein [Candidatus Moranbacteria bacterium]